MIFRKKNILLVSPEPWDHIFVSKHHYATHLGKRGNHVFFLNPPSESESITQTGYKNVSSVTYLGFPKGLRFFPSIVQKYFIRKKFFELQKFCNVQFDVVWSFDNSVFFDLSALPQRVLKISHIVDLKQDFQTAKAASTASVCLCTTDLLKERLSAFNSRVFKINHGLNECVVQKRPISLPGHSSIKALYAGNMAMRFIDWELLRVAVESNPTVDFIFVGPDSIDDANIDDHGKNELMKSDNSFFIGKVESGELPSWYEASDILLVAYQERYHADQSNPHKMMEYLGSGKMIVATYMAEYKMLADETLFLMSNHNAEFPLLLKEAVRDLTLWNDWTKQEARIAYALENTYFKQIERIEAITEDL
ncbi:MAG TPA: hypothetical protein VFW11_20375 [Cyclobacteriaceae bacterium]|nr:hypothetical protein [Cyclobacteriaceae bacterium]